MIHWVLVDGMGDPLRSAFVHAPLLDADGSFAVEIMLLHQHGESRVSLRERQSLAERKTTLPAGA